MTKPYWITLVLLAGLLGVVFTLHWGSREPGARPFLALPDGSQVRVMAVTFGTNHVVGPILGRWAARAPTVVRVVMEKLLGPHAVARHTSMTSSPTLVVWLERATNSAAPWNTRGYLEAFLSDAQGFASGENVTLGTGSWPSPETLHFRAFPRRDRVIGLDFYYHDSTGGVRQCGRLAVPNPACRRFPNWTPEPLPASHRAGDVEVTLERLSTGHGPHVTHMATAGGGKSIEFGARTGGRNETVCLIRLQSLTDTNQVWRVSGVEVSDATGNQVKNSSLAWGSAQEPYVRFAPGLWASEAAWKVNCEIKRTEGFGPEERFTFENVALGDLEKTNVIRWSTNVAGVSVTFEYLFRRAPNTNESWSSSELSRARVTVDGLTNGMHLDLLTARSDTGGKLHCVSWSSSGRDRDYSFRNIPLEAKTADFTFAVQRSRRVEFVVKPEVGTARLEF